METTSDTLQYVMVTGGAGFLGRHICKKLLETNHFVYCLDNLITGNIANIQEFANHPLFIHIKYDITKNLELLNLPKIQKIYHLACIASPDKYKQYSIETLDTCFQGTKNVLEFAKLNKSKVLFTSTSEIYGDPHVHPQPEEYFGNVNTVGERSCYDEGKRVGETLCYEYRKRYDLDVKIVRLFNTYGPYMDINDGRVITNFIRQIKIGEPLYIYGNGLQTRSFCYVDDMIKGLIAMMESCESGPINLGNPNCEFTLNELVALFENIIDDKVEVKYIDSTENDPKQRKPSIEKAYAKLAFQPIVGIEEGLKNTMAYFMETPV
jgi:UDP-glucuronate decarboxylase